MILIITLILSSIFCGKAINASTFQTIEATERRDSSDQPQTPMQQTMGPLRTEKRCFFICPPHCHAYCNRTWYAKIWECTKFPCAGFPEEKNLEDSDEKLECDYLCRAFLMPIAIGTTCICDCCLLFYDTENTNDN